MAHRRCVVSYTDWHTTLDQFTSRYGDLSDTLIVTHVVDKAEASNQINFNTLKRQLGNSYSAVLLDLSKGIHISALAILAGTVRGGGVFVLHLGPDWLTQPDQELDRYLPWPLTSHDHESFYKTLFWQAIHAGDSPFSTVWPNTIEPVLRSSCALTAEQENVIQQIVTSLSGCHFLIAARGRGKSYALAELLERASQQGLACACTASSPLNIASLAEHYVELTGTKAPFKAADALVSDSSQYDLLLVDEAASLPLPVLEALIEKANCIVFSSTDYGYEGSGKGFGIRFRQQLAMQSIAFKQHRLKHAIRWGENDPLENWLDALLFKEYQVTNQCPDQPKCLQGKEWLSYPSLLDQAFALLVSAHYQTSPENKRWMIDDPSVLTYCLYEQKRLVGVALVTAEGELPEELSQAVMEGTRRPRGHLIPQSLLAHEGIQEAGQYRYWRISRIAIAEDVQRQGLGSQLLSMIEHDAKRQKVDFLSTSFAATVDVTHFWRQANFIGVRLGTGKDQASGAYSLMMIKGLNPTSQELSKAWSQGFHRDWLETLCLNLRDLSPELILSIHSTLSMGENPHIIKTSTKDVSDLTYFCQHHRPFDAIRPALLRLTMQQLQQGKLLSNSADDRLLLGCAINTVTERDAHKLGFSGKKAFYQQLKHIISLQLNQLKNG